MKPEQIVALVVRLFAVVVAIYTLRGGISLVPYFYGQGWEGASYAYAGIMIALIILAFCLWKFPLIVARGLVNFHNGDESDVTSTNAEQFQIVGFNILGLYLLFYVISDIIYWATILSISNRIKISR